MCEPLVVLEVYIRKFCHLRGATNFRLIMHRGHSIFRVVLATGVAIFWFRAQFALLPRGSSRITFSRVLVAFVDRRRGIISQCYNYMLWLINEPSWKITDSNSEHLVRQKDHNSTRSYRKLLFGWYVSENYRQYAVSCRCYHDDLCGVESIINCRTSHIGCAVIRWVVNGGLFRLEEVRRTMEENMIDVPFCGTACTTTGCECHGTTLRFLGKLPWMNRSINSVPCSKSTARLRTIPIQTRVCRSPILRWRRIVLFG